MIIFNCITYIYIYFKYRFYDLGPRACAWCIGFMLHKGLSIEFRARPASPAAIKTSRRTET